MSSATSSRVDVLSLLDAYASAQEKGQTHYKSTLWNINKARRQKGRDSIRAVDVREELYARSVLVKQEQAMPVLVEEGDKVEKQEDGSFTLVDPLEFVAAKKENEESSPDGPKTTGLRQRKKAGDNTDQTDSEKWTFEEELDREQNLLRHANPIDLFGALHPPDLKLAQKEAKRTIQAYVEAANLAAAILQATSKK